MNRRHGRFPVLRALLSGALAVGACGHAEDPTNVSVTIDPTVSHQTLVGFGAATAYQAYLLSDRTDDIYQVLFVDSGLDILRLGNWYQNQSSTSTTDTPFSDSASVQIVQKATAARGGTPPKILMSAWTPPAHLKSNGVTRPPRDGFGPDLSGGHADRERGRLRLLRIRRLVGSLAAGLRGRGRGAGLRQHPERARLLHPVLGDLPVRRQRGRIDERHRRRRVRASAGRGLPRHSGLRPGDPTGAARSRDHRLPRRRRGEIHGRPRPRATGWHRAPPVRKHRRTIQPPTGSTVR